MAEVGRTGRVIKDFPGIELGTDLHELKEGSSDVQTNCTSEEFGTLRSRHGYVTLNFEGE